MRWIALAALLALGGCIPSGGAKRPPSRPAGAQSTSQCRADLAREGVRFRALEDRLFGNGCSAVGAVQLLDIGTPVTNLGAMTCPLARQFARWSREAVQPA